jgi:hypothetical protein
MYGILDFDFHDKIFNCMVACRKPSGLMTMVWSRP